MNSATNFVSQYLLQLIRQQLKQHCVVVWFDPEKQYESLARAENFPDAQLFCYDPRQGFMALRRQLEPVWGAVEPPHLLIYVPLSEGDSHHALVEFTTAGVTLQPGQQPAERNTRLSAIARQALNGILPAKKLANVIDETEKGHYSLSELDEIASRFKDTQIGVLSLIFKTENVEDICLQFLASDRFDADIQAKNATATLVTLLKDVLEVQLGEKDGLKKVRESLGRYLLLSEFASCVGASLPASLSMFKAPNSKAAVETSLRLIKEWRQRNDTAASYIEAAQKVEAELGLTKHPWTVETLQAVETFAGIDAILQTLLENALIGKPVAEFVEIAQRRQDAFWPGKIPSLKLHWQLIVEAGQVLVQASLISSAVKQNWAAAALVRNYTGSRLQSGAGLSPWCKLDTVFRRLERDEHSFDFETEQHDSLQKLLNCARSSYADALHSMTEQFIRAYEDADFHLPEFVQQTSIYHDFVQPALENGKAAYILVDSFRYEMALDLLEQIQSDCDCQVTPALATPPTITEVGMAALLPNAERGLCLASGGPGKLCVILQKSALKNRADRVKFLESYNPLSVIVELGQIAPLKDKKIINALANAKLTVVTATDEIDGMWESHPEIARRLHDDVFNQLRRGIRNLLNAGYQSIIITSDHGFVAGDNLMTGTPMDPPGGDTVDLHRRVWIGHGGAEILGCLRKPVSAFGIDSDLELVTPLGLGCFKTAGGSTQYFHGGLSPQEMIIPVLSIHPGKGYSASAKEPAFKWSITLGSKQISTRFFSVSINGNATDLLAAPPRIRVELILQNQVVSIPVAATYGLDETTKDVRMKMEEGSTVLAENTVTLFIDEIPTTAASLDLNLINSETGISLFVIQNIPIAIAL